VAAKLDDGRLVEVIYLSVHTTTARVTLVVLP